MSTLIHNRFQAEKGFGSKFLYIVDRTVQIFLDRTTTNWDDNGQPNYLLLKAQELVDKVEDGPTLNITLPNVLMVAGGTEKDKIVKEPATKKARPSTPTCESPKKVSFYANPSEVHTNVNTHASWKVPDSQNFLELLKDRFPCGKPWPRFGKMYPWIWPCPHKRGQNVGIRISSRGQDHLGGNHSEIQNLRAASTESKVHH